MNLIIEMFRQAAVMTAAWMYIRVRRLNKKSGEEQFTVTRYRTGAWNPEMNPKPPRLQIPQVVSSPVQTTDISVAQK